jgi:LacI family transcriptional regulator
MPRGVTSRPPSEAAGIKEIARALGVSIGTVDRALHNRPGISPLTRERVLNMAETIGYRPNLAARYLKAGKQFVLSVNLPREIASFFDTVREGIREAAASFEITVRVEFRTPPRLGEHEVDALEEALADGASGIIIAPAHPAEVEPLIRKAAAQNVPVVCVVTDAPGTERLTAVYADPYTSGAISAEILTRFCCKGGPVALVTGFRDTMDHAEKVRGFRETLQRLGSPLVLSDLVEARDDEHEAYQRTRQVLAQRPDLTAVYVSTANSPPVIAALRDAGRLRQVTAMTTDLFPQIADMVRSGDIAATIYQRPMSQGRIAFEALYRFLADRRRPQPQIKLVPHVVMRANLDLVLEKQPLEIE